MEKVSIPNYDSFENLDLAYSDFISRFESVINVIAPIKSVRIKNNASEWFDGDIADEIHRRDKPYKKCKLINFHVDEDLYREARNTVRKFNSKKEKNVF